MPSAWTTMILVQLFSSTTHVLFIGHVLKQTIWLKLNLNSQPMPRFEPGTPNHNLFITSDKLNCLAIGPDTTSPKLNELSLLYQSYLFFFTVWVILNSFWKCSIYRRFSRRCCVSLNYIANLSE